MRKRRVTALEHSRFREALCLLGRMCCISAGRTREPLAVAPVKPKVAEVGTQGEARQNEAGQDVGEKPWRWARQPERPGTSTDGRLGKPLKV